MEDMFAQRAVAVLGMLFWFSFPIGIMISVIQQDKDAHHPESEKKWEPIHHEETKKSA
ncbi:MAG: hypothetical protein ACXVLQ_15000 [Bacteriovorax sp.]